MEENKNENVEPVTEVPIEEVKAEETVTEPVVTEGETTPEETSDIPAPVEEPKKKKPKASIILIILALIALVVLAIFYLKPKGETKNNSDDNTEGNETTTVQTQNKFKSEYRMSGNSLEKFDLAFLKLENEEKNKVYSPLSVKYALEMLAEGSSGDSKDQIDAVIGDYKAKKYKNSANMSFANAMFIRDTFSDNVKEEYIAKLRDKYGAEVILDSFASPNTINNWVNDKTLKLIPNLVDDVSDKDFYLVNALGIDMEWENQIHCAMNEGYGMETLPCISYSVNYEHEKLQGENDEYERISYPYAGDYTFPTIDFKTNDNNIIKVKGSTVLASFNRYDVVKTIGEDKIREEVGKAYREWLETDEVKKSMDQMKDEYKDPDKYVEIFINELNKNYGMENYSTDFYLHVDDDVKVFAKDLKKYNGTTLQYVGIMPKKASLKEYIENVSAEDINKIISSLKDMKIKNFTDGYATIIEGDIPLFKYEYELQLMKDLKKLEITDVFDTNKSDLSAMLNDAKGEFIAEAKHKANIEFSNDGIKAAAATQEGGMGNAKYGFNYLYEVPTIRIDMTFDNPYMYLIRDKATGEVWFVGTVYEPIKK